MQVLHRQLLKLMFDQCEHYVLKYKLSFPNHTIDFVEYVK